jgi:hypothetical protein
MGRFDRVFLSGYALGQVAHGAIQKQEDIMETFLNETQLSEMLQVSLACLRRRLRGEGPEYRIQSDQRLVRAFMKQLNRQRILPRPSA